MSFGSADPLLKPMSGDLLGFMLATGSEPPVLDGSREQLLMAVGGPAADVAGPNWVQCRVPGYRTARRTFFSDRVSPDPGWLVVELQPSCDSWGSVLVSAEGVPEGLGEERLPGGIGGYLVLGSAEREDWFPFALPLQGTRRLDGVPTGTYHVHFRNLQGEKQHLLEGDQALVEIGAEETSLRFDLRAAGAVEFTLLDQRGDPYGGWFVADLARGEPRVVNGRLRMADAQRYTFPGPPYVVPLLREGGYFLGVHRPRIGESIESSILRIETARGKTQHVVLTCDGEVR